MLFFVGFATLESDSSIFGRQARESSRNELDFIVLRNHFVRSVLSHSPAYTIKLTKKNGEKKLGFFQMFAHGG